MNFPSGLLPALWSWGAIAILVPVALLAAWNAPWRRLFDSTQSHGWFGAIVILAMMWSIKAGVTPGLDLHLLGATALTLMFGRSLAILGMCLVVTAVTANGEAGWQSYGLNALLLAVLPVLLAHGILRLVERFLPAHMFVYIFCAAFFGAWVTVSLVGLAAILLLAAAGVYSLQSMLSDYFPYYILLGFAEAWMNGAAITLLVVYFPHWVWSFDDRRYLLNK